MDYDIIGTIETIDFRFFDDGIQFDITAYDEKINRRKGCCIYLEDNEFLSFVREFCSIFETVSVITITEMKKRFGMKSNNQSAVFICFDTNKSFQWEGKEIGG